MGNYFCPDCGYEGDEPICPYCNKVAESLKVDARPTVLDEKYSTDELQSVEELAVEELAEKPADDLQQPPEEDQSRKD